VLGDGLAAGASNFTLSADVQNQSFPAQMARQMQTVFPQPLIQPPGIGGVAGFPQLPGRFPAAPQTTLRASPTPLLVFNLSVPGLKLADSFTRRPALPLVHTDDVDQTVLNFVLGFPSLVLPQDVPLWTQLEYAQAMQPTLVLVELGYSDVLEAAVKGDVGLLPDPARFMNDYARILGALRETFAEIVVLTIPDPARTAYFSSVAGAAGQLGVPDSLLVELYGLRGDDLLSIGAIMEIGMQLQTGDFGPLSGASVISAATAGSVSRRVSELNASIVALGKEQGAVVYDLSGLFLEVRNRGVTVGGITLTGDYLGGFFSLDGSYPGTTGHGLIANRILSLLNTTYGQSFPLVDVGTLSASDHAALSRPLKGRPFTTQELQGLLQRMKNRNADASMTDSLARWIEKNPEGAPPRGGRTVP